MDYSRAHEEKIAERRHKQTLTPTPSLICIDDTHCSLRTWKHVCPGVQVVASAKKSFLCITDLAVGVARLVKVKTKVSPAIFQLAPAGTTRD
jgi:hypothetical protein